MLSHKVIAQNITNLTDARYFAAWGVDYLSYNLIPDSDFFIATNQVEEIKEWVEGPETLVESNSLEFDEIADGRILSQIYSSLPLNKPCFFRTTVTELQKGLPEGKYIIKIESMDDISQIHSMNEDQLLGLDIYLDISSIPFSSEILETPHGLAIQGGEEEKVGFKSYDELDELFDLLLN